MIVMGVGCDGVLICTVRWKEQLRECNVLGGNVDLQARQ